MRWKQHDVTTNVLLSGVSECFFVQAASSPFRAVTNVFPAHATSRWISRRPACGIVLQRRLQTSFSIQSWFTPCHIHIGVAAVTFNEPGPLHTVSPNSRQTHLPDLLPRTRFSGSCWLVIAHSCWLPGVSSFYSFNTLSYHRRGTSTLELLQRLGG
jgi:hypothetical protein